MGNEKEQQETEVYTAALPLSSAVRTGLEPATPGVTGLYSNRLNYRTILLRFFARNRCGSFASAKLDTFFFSTKFFWRKISRKFHFFLSCSLKVLYISVLSSRKKFKKISLFLPFSLRAPEKLILAHLFYETLP